MSVWNGVTKSSIFIHDKLEPIYFIPIKTIMAAKQIRNVFKKTYDGA